MTEESKKNDFVSMLHSIFGIDGKGGKHKRAPTARNKRGEWKKLHFWLTSDVVETSFNQICNKELKDEYEVRRKGKRYVVINTHLGPMLPEAWGYKGLVFIKVKSTS